MNRRSRFGASELAILLLAGLATACGGGGGSSSSSSQSGSFIDSPVQGLRYQGDSLAGRTGSSGGYQFEDGDEVCFFIDGVALGCLFAREPGVVTPMDIFDAASDDPAVQNMVRFLLALDVDGDASNGIDVGDIDTGDNPPPIDFEQSMAAFETDPDVLDFIDTYGFDGDLVDMITAANHFAQSLEDSNYFEQDAVGRWLYTRRMADETAESDVLEIAFGDVDGMQLDVDEDGDVEFLKFVDEFGSSCQHEGSVEDEAGDRVEGSILCQLQQAGAQPQIVVLDSFRMDRLVSGTAYAIEDLSAPVLGWQVASSVIPDGSVGVQFDAQFIADSNASISSGGVVRFDLDVDAETCGFEGRMNSAKTFVSGDVDCPGGDAAWEMGMQQLVVLEN